MSDEYTGVPRDELIRRIKNLKGAVAELQALAKERDELVGAVGKFAMERFDRPIAMHDAWQPRSAGQTFAQLVHELALARIELINRALVELDDVKRERYGTATDPLTLRTYLLDCADSKNPVDVAVVEVEWELTDKDTSPRARMVLRWLR